MSVGRRSTRHPAALAQGDDLVGSTRRLASGRERDLERMGIDGPERVVATATMAVRGREQRTRPEFAAAYGLSEAELARIEAGCVAVHELPAVLRVLTPVESVIASCQVVVASSGRDA